MACIGGILAYVALNMVKPAEVRHVFAQNRFHVALMAYTAGMVIVTDFLTGVLSAIVIYAVLGRFLDRPQSPDEPKQESLNGQAERNGQLTAAGTLEPAPAE
jgi:MFS superfamily sulfate permease-like transporter